MKIGKIKFANGNIHEIENIELGPEEIEAFEKLVNAMIQLEKTRLTSATVRTGPR